MNDKKRECFCSSVARILGLGGLSPKPSWGFGGAVSPPMGFRAEPLEAFKVLGVSEVVFGF